MTTQQKQIRQSTEPDTHGIHKSVFLVLFKYELKAYYERDLEPRDHHWLCRKHWKTQGHLTSEFGLKKNDPVAGLGGAVQW
jgi:hypothetical protein